MLGQLTDFCLGTSWEGGIRRRQGTTPYRLQESSMKAPSISKPTLQGWLWKLRSASAPLIPSTALGIRLSGHTEHDRLGSWGRQWRTDGERVGPRESRKSLNVCVHPNNEKHEFRLSVHSNREEIRTGASATNTETITDVHSSKSLWSAPGQSSYGRLINTVMWGQLTDFCLGPQSPWLTQAPHIRDPQSWGASKLRAIEFLIVSVS